MRYFAGCAVLCSALLFSARSVAANDWQGIYGVQAVDRPGLEQDLAELSARGINLVAHNVGLVEDSSDPNQPGWRQYYDLAIAHNVKLIPILWDPAKNQTVWQWVEVRQEFKLDANTFPFNAGARFIKFLRDNPTYLNQTFALYSFHEPFNDENPESMRTVAQNRKFWSQVHDEEFPDGGLAIYGEDVSPQVPGCENGCVDYAQNGVYSFSACAGVPRYNALTLTPLSGGGFATGHDTCLVSKDEVIARALSQLDFFHDHAHGAPPAPDGSYTRFLVLVQTYAADPALNLYSRMPSASEMRDWVEQIVLARKSELVGVMWYSWRDISTNYQQWLHQNRYDDTGADRWQVVSEVAPLVVAPEPPEPPGCGIGPELAAVLAGLLLLRRAAR